MLKICEKNSSVNLRLEIFVMAFRVRKLFGTFEKRAPGVFFSSHFRDMGKVMPVVFGEIKISFCVRKQAS